MLFQHWHVCSECSLIILIVSALGPRLPIIGADNTCPSWMPINWWNFRERDSHNPLRAGIRDLPSLFSRLPCLPFPKRRSVERERAADTPDATSELFPCLREARGPDLGEPREGIKTVLPNTINFQHTRSPLISKHPSDLSPTSHRVRGVFAHYETPHSQPAWLAVRAKQPCGSCAEFHTRSLLGAITSNHVSCDTAGGRRAKTALPSPPAPVSSETSWRRCETSSNP